MEEKDTLAQAIRVYIYEYWKLTPRYYISVTGVIIGVIGLLVAITYDSIIGVSLSVVLLALSIVGVVLCRLNRKQQYYLDLIGREYEELKSYDEILFKNGVENKLDDHWATRRQETKTRIETAREQLEEAVYAVYREDYVSFLSAYYWANSQKIFIFELLDAADHGSHDHHLDWTLELELPKLPGQQVREHGTIEVPATDIGETRLWNLQKWILSVKKSLPDAQREEVDQYLLTSNGEIKESPTGQELYRALQVIQAWDIQRLSELMNIRRFLRLLIPFVFAVLLAALLVLGGTVNGEQLTTPLTSENAAADPAVMEFRFVVLIAITGLLGALFSMAVSVENTSYTVTSYRSIPDPTVMREAMITRFLIGGISALVLFTIVQSSIGTALFSEDIQANRMALLIVAFLGGYSERLVQRSLENAEGMISRGNGERTQSQEVNRISEEST